MTKTLLVDDAKPAPASSMGLATSRSRFFGEFECGIFSRSCASAAKPMVCCHDFLAVLRVARMSGLGSKVRLRASPLFLNLPVVQAGGRKSATAAVKHPMSCAGKMVLGGFKHVTGRDHGHALDHGRQGRAGDGGDFSAARAAATARAGSSIP